MLDGIGRGVPRSVACGREFTIVATHPCGALARAPCCAALAEDAAPPPPRRYDGPNEVEIMQQENLAVQSAEVTALREAEEDLARAKDSQQAVAETLRAMTKVTKTKSDLCTLCAVRAPPPPRRGRPPAQRVHGGTGVPGVRAQPVQALRVQALLAPETEARPRPPQGRARGAQEKMIPLFVTFAPPRTRARHAVRNRDSLSSSASTRERSTSNLITGTGGVATCGCSAAGP